ncbi:MAG TPA: phosphatase PAP2 family protein, partial [Gammaproteobacteria bacterium]|nr:phosphatase PAP2 family protein [Gammaproteobacteria bacterium]
TSAALWAPVYMLPGILLGAASLELPPDIATRVMLILLFWSLFILLCLWLIRKIPAIIHQQIIRALNALWNKLQKSRHGGLIKALLRHHNPAQTSIQLTLFFYLLLVSGVFAYLALFIKNHGSEALFINQSVYHLFRGIYTTDGKNIMVFITLLGQKQVLLPAAALIIAWLFLQKRWNVALHTSGLFCLTAASIHFIKNYVQSARPWGVLELPTSFSFPSGHSTLTTVFYIGFALLIAKSLTRFKRKLSYTLALAIAAIISLSRLYLGVHWFTDIIGAWLLAAALLILISILYNRYQDKPLKVKKLLSITFVCLFLIYLPAAYYYVPKLQNDFTKLDFPAQESEMDIWWNSQDKNFLPEWRVSLVGLPSQSINLEWADQLPTIEKTLMKSGWQTPPDRAWIDILFRVSGIQSNEHLPLISPFYLDKKPALVLVKQVRKDKILVIQLWPSNRVLSKTHEPIWVGVVGLVPRTYGWLSHHNKMDIDITPDLVFDGKTNAQHKLIQVMIPGKRRDRQQTILLVR